MIKVDPRVKNVLEWVVCIIVALILALLFRHFIGTPTVVKQTSMKSTLIPNDRLFLNRWIVTTHGEFKRGDIITFEAPSVSQVGLNADLSNPVAKYTRESKGGFDDFCYYFLEIGKTSYIKRIIGVAGDHVEIKNNKVYLNEEELDEPYLDEGMITTGEGGAFTNIVVPEGYVFAMGDNRTGSTDCRMFGCIPIEKIEGKVLFRFWPLNKFGKVN